MPKTQIVTDKAKPVAAYSTGWKVSGGSLIFLAGQVAIDPDGAFVGKGDIEAQTRQIFENLKAALEAGGATLADIVQLNMFMTDREEFPAAMGVRKTFLFEPHPASTLLFVSGLANPDWKIEIDVVAFVEDN
ncbi:MAG: RidA family protein [bacterium]